MPPLRARLPKVPMPETLTLVINGYQFALAAPYTFGKPLGEAEASLLNREWAQAVRSSFAAQVQNALAANEEKLTLSQVETLQSALSDFASQFSFKAVASPRNTDALTRQKHTIAKRVLEIRLNAQGLTKDAWGEHKYEAALARLMNNHEVIAQAEANLASTRDAADMLAGMGET